jgi:hypothetical protein
MSLTGLSFSLITGTRKNRKPGIFLEARVGQGELAKNKY